MDEVVATLASLRCPYAGVAADGRVFVPGEARYVLLEWLINRYDPALLPSAERHDPLLQLNTESGRVLRLANLLHVLALVPANDVDTVRGTGQQTPAQVRLLTRLCRLVAFAARGALDGASLDDVFDRSQAVLNQLGMQCHDVFQPSVTVFPSGRETEHKFPRPPAAELTSLRLKLTQRVQDDAARAEDLGRRSAYHPRSEYHASGAQLSDELSRAQRAMSAFTTLYDTEFGLWTNKPAPERSGLGPASKVTIEKWQAFTQLITAYSHTQDSVAAVQANKFPSTSHLDADRLATQAEDLERITSTLRSDAASAQH